MNALEMISGPLLFVEHLHEQTRKVHQAVEMIPLLLEALLTSDHQRVTALHQQISEIRDQAKRIKHSLYDQFADMHFRSTGGYAVGQYIAGLDKVAESADAFADILVSRKSSIPIELHADLKALASKIAHMNGQILMLTESIWPPEESVPTEPQTRDVLDAIERIVEDHHQARQLRMEFYRHLHNLEDQLDPSILLYLDKSHTTLQETANHVEVAANLLRMVIQ
jgi:uncharacterized protein Yka (UPF0111/DUF47 family)